MTSETTTAREATEQWAWEDADGGDDCGGPFPTRDEAFDDAVETYLEQCEGQWDTPTIYLGRVELVPVGRYARLDPDELMNTIESGALEDGVGGDGDGRPACEAQWSTAPEGREAAADELAGLLAGWANKHLAFDRGYWGFKGEPQTVDLKDSDLPGGAMDEFEDDEDAGVDVVVGEEGGN